MNQEKVEKLIKGIIDSTTINYDGYDHRCKFCSAKMSDCSNSTNMIDLIHDDDCLYKLARDLYYNNSTTVLLTAIDDVLECINSAGEPNIYWIKNSLSEAKEICKEYSQQNPILLTAIDDVLECIDSAGVPNIIWIKKRLTEAKKFI